MSERIDISDVIDLLCERLGVDKNRAYRADIDVDKVTVYRLRTREGRTYVTDDGEAAWETVVVPVRT